MVKEQARVEMLSNRVGGGGNNDVVDQGVASAPVVGWWWQQSKRYGFENSSSRHFYLNLVSPAFANCSSRHFVNFPAIFTSRNPHTYDAISTLPLHHARTHQSNPVDAFDHPLVQ